MSLNAINPKPSCECRELFGRNHVHGKFAAISLLLALIFIFPEPSFAYVGPGAGITALGALWALIATAVITLGGLLIWPIRAFLKRKKGSPTQADATGSGETLKTDIE